MAVTHHSLALREIHDAAQAYEDETAGLGDRFLDAVDQAVQLIANYPQAGGEIEPGVYRFPLRHFPFSLVYETRAGGLFIAAVAHHRREPGYWQDRV